MEEKKNNKLFLIGLCVMAAVLFFAFTVNIFSEKNTQNKPELESEEMVYGKIPSQEYGNSDAFYKGEDGEAILINFGMGNIDVSEGIKKWSFGEPVISLKYAAEKMGLTISERPPKGANLPEHAEAYPEGYDIDLESRKPFYLIDKENNFIQFKANSSVAMSSDGTEIPLDYYPEYIEEEKDLYVSVTTLPIMENGIIKVNSGSSYKYEEDKIIISLLTDEE